MASAPTDIKGAEIHLIGQVTAQKGKADELEGYLKKIQVNARGVEAGCRVYNVLRYGDSFCVVEHYKDKAALDEHMASNAFQTFAKQLDTLTLPGTFVLKFFAEVVGDSAETSGKVGGVDLLASATLDDPSQRSGTMS